MDFSSLDIAQLSILDGFSVVRIPLHQHENKKKKCNDKKKKQLKAYRSVIQVHFWIAPLLEIRMKEKEFCWIDRRCNFNSSSNYWRN